MRKSFEQRKQDAEDAEYLMGWGRWWDDGDFVARRPHTICWRYLVVSRRRVRRRLRHLKAAER